MFKTKVNSRIAEMFLFDVFVAILKIEDTAKDYTNVQELLFNYRDWDSIIREFEIIGEAVKHLINNNLIEKEYQIVVDLRNYINHNYFGISPERIWDIIHNGDLEELLNIITVKIDKIDKKLKEEMIDSFSSDNSYLTFIVDRLNNLKAKP